VVIHGQPEQLAITVAGAASGFRLVPARTWFDYAVAVMVRSSWVAGANPTACAAGRCACWRPRGSAEEVSGGGEGLRRWQGLLPAVRWPRPPAPAPARPLRRPGGRCEAAVHLPVFFLAGGLRRR